MILASSKFRGAREILFGWRIRLAPTVWQVRKHSDISFAIALLRPDPVDRERGRILAFELMIVSHGAKGREFLDRQLKALTALAGMRAEIVEDIGYRMGEHPTALAASVTNSSPWRPRPPAS